MSGITTRRLHRLIFFLAALLAPLIAVGQDAANPRAIAERYMSAVEAMDWARMESLLHATAVFEDPTAETFGEPWKIEGGQNIVAFYRNQAEGSDTLDTRYRVIDAFTTGARTVFNLEIDVRVRAGMVGHPEDIIEDTMRVVTVITVDSERVVHHIDYADYDEMFRRLEGHKQRLDAAQFDAAQ